MKTEKTENMIVKISLPMEGAIVQYLLQFPGRSRASIVSMILAEYLACGGCFGVRAAAAPVVAAVAPVIAAPEPAKITPPSPVVREPEVLHLPPPPTPIMAAERPLSSPSSARDKIKDMLS